MGPHSIISDRQGKQISLIQQIKGRLRDVKERHQFIMLLGGKNGLRTQPAVSESSSVSSSVFLLDLHLCPSSGLSGVYYALLHLITVKYNFLITS